jgi:hypothetical protein
MSDREARRKILLLKGTLYRLEIMQARQTLQNAASRNSLIESVPGLIKAALSKQGAGLITTLLPLLLGRGRWRRYVRRTLLAAGGVMAAWRMFSRDKHATDKDTIRHS